MKIAVPTTSSNMVDAHFGHCQFYTIFSIDEKMNIQKTEILESPQGCGCKSSIAGILKEMGVKVMLAGNMGDGAVNVLTRHEIEVYRGCSGNVTKLVQEFIKGQIADSGETCDHHNGDHQCNHPN